MDKIESTSEADDLIVRAKDLMLEILQKGGLDMRSLAFEEMADANPGCTVNSGDCAGCKGQCTGGQGTGCLK